MERTYIAQTLKNIGQKVTITGRVQTVRDHGKVIFFDITDETGLVQTVTREKIDIAPQDIVKIEGTVKKRPANLINSDIETGTIEIDAQNLRVVSKSQTLPIPTDTDGMDIEEDLRLKYRYLDLRRPRMQKNLRLRAQIAAIIRDYLNKEGFTEIETPYLSKTTPEGARDFIVPSRLHPGNFYALAQAPQQYKQLLMLSGFEKYFQFARAFRDEDMRADRQLEHTQIDIEVAYAKREDILKVVEGLATFIAEGMRKKKDENTLAFAWVVDFPLFSYDEKEKRYTFSHNPFTAPKEESVGDLMKLANLDKIESYQYDLVLNGEEIGSGSIRITGPKVQRQVFAAMGHSDKKIDSDFGHLLEAYEYGAPTHGGIALGFDRF